MIPQTALAKLRQVVEKQGPPRPGLVPQSGDPQHPGRWVRPKDGGDGVVPVARSNYQRIVEEHKAQLRGEGHEPTPLAVKRSIAGDVLEGYQGFRDTLEAVTLLRTGAVRYTRSGIEVNARTLEDVVRDIYSLDKGALEEMLTELASGDGTEKSLQASLVGLGRLTKAIPPRAGLVPQSGDPEHPVRWIRPKGEGKMPETSAVGEVAGFDRSWFPIVDIGMLSAEERKALKVAVRDGRAVKYVDYTFPQTKTGYAIVEPGIDPGTQAVREALRSLQEGSWSNVPETQMEVAVRLRGELRGLIAKPVDKSLSGSVLELLAATMQLASGYITKEGDNEDAEEGRPFPSHDHVSALPEVPPEVPPSAKERETLNEATSLLRAAYASPNINAALADNDLERLRLAIGYLGRMESVNLDVDRVIGKGLSKATQPEADIDMSVKAIIKDAGGRTLVLKDAYSDYWDLAGGHVRDGETLEEALRREVREEIGLNLGVVTEREVRVLKMDKVKPVVFFDADATGELQLSEEHTDYLWADYEDLQRLNLGVFKEILLGDDKEEKGLVTDMPGPARGVEKQGPPRPGLIPQSGDPQHPVRWVRPEEQGAPTDKPSQVSESSIDQRKVVQEVVRGGSVTSYSDAVAVAAELAEVAAPYYEKRGFQRDEVGKAFAGWKEGTFGSLESAVVMAMMEMGGGTDLDTAIGNTLKKPVTGFTRKEAESAIKEQVAEHYVVWQAHREVIRELLGDTVLTLYRGANGNTAEGKDLQPGDKITFGKDRPISRWTMTKAVADTFAGSAKKKGYVFSIQVTADQLLFADGFALSTTNAGELEVGLDIAGLEGTVEEFVKPKRGWW